MAIENHHVENFVIPSSIVFHARIAAPTFPWYKDEQHAYVDLKHSQTPELALNEGKDIQVWEKMCYNQGISEEKWLCTIPFHHTLLSQQEAIHLLTLKRNHETGNPTDVLQYFREGIIRQNTLY